MHPKRGPKKNILTTKQRKFVDYYVDCGNAAEAARKAGYKSGPKELLKKPHVKEQIEKKLLRVTQETDISAERVLEELGRIAFANLGDYLEWNGTTVKPKSSRDLTPEQRASIEEVFLTRNGVRLKLYDKLAALEKLGKHLGLFSDKVKHEGELTIQVRMPEDLEEYY